MQNIGQESQERKNQEIGYALVIKKPSFLNRLKEFGGFFKWLDYKWRNLLGKPSKDGKRRLIEKDDKHEFTKGTTDFQTKPEDFIAVNPGSTLVVESITNTPSQTTVSIDNTTKSKLSVDDFSKNKSDKPSNNSSETIAKQIDDELDSLNAKGKPKKKNTVKRKPIAKKKPAAKKKISTKKKLTSKKTRK